MPKLSRPLQILLTPWLDEWIAFLSERYEVPKATIMRNLIHTGILVWNICTEMEKPCQLIEKLTDNSPELRKCISDGTMSQEDAELFAEDLAYLARRAVIDNKEKMK